MHPRQVVITLTLLVLPACQTAMSVEEAKKVSTSFSGAAFVPPPRTITDVTAILDKQKPADPAERERARTVADRTPPHTQDATTLARFYFERALAAAQIGRNRQELEDLREAVKHAPGDVEILRQLGITEQVAGNYRRGIEAWRREIAASATQPFRQIGAYANIARTASVLGDVETAEAALAEAERAHAGFMSNFRGNRGTLDGHIAAARASLALTKGNLQASESLSREAVAAYQSDEGPTGFRQVNPELARMSLVVVLVRQGRLLEAENEARGILRSMVSKRGRDSTYTAPAIRLLARVLIEQGRYTDAEALLRVAADVYLRTGAPDSTPLARTRHDLATALVAQGRWADALAEYERIRVVVEGDPTASARLLGNNLDWGVALLQTGQAARAVHVLMGVVDHRLRVFGPDHASVAEARGFLAVARVAAGDRARALQEFGEATRVLLARVDEAVDDEGASRGIHDLRLTRILTGYLALLADTRGTPLATGVADPPAEAFRIAEVARGRSVQRALDASATRAAATTPTLADLVRREQDARKQISALHGMLAVSLGQSTDPENTRTIAQLRSQIDTLGRARRALSAQISRDFPTYAQLLNPPPANIADARSALRPGEAWVVTYVAEARTYVWAIPKDGPVGFTAVALGERELAERVAVLRRALDSEAQTLGDIPAFDLAIAHDLYRVLLEPVGDGWRKAESLLVVAHGPLGQLPFSVLVTKPVTLGAETGALFSNYRAVPWLARTHAVTVLPSVTALGTLRTLPAADAGRRPFVGFGDPWFSVEQAQRATREAAPAVTTVASRGVPIHVRNLTLEAKHSAQLATLPRLPETADEIRAIAEAMNADPVRDVFLGERANEQAVRTANLAGYRVIAFATHGLVPGDLDGLTQPALALTAPEVAKVPGDGLLTLEKILALRLNADWVVLSACNTASGNGAGSDAVSGLGRAFFYAGARSLLVSNWPVETTSARTLTTELFRRQHADPGLTRARALKETMNALIDTGHLIDSRTNQIVASYAHPLFWAPFTVVGDGGR